MSTGWRTEPVFIRYSSEYIHPSRQSSQEGLVLLEMSQYGMTKPQIKLYKNDRDSLEWGEGSKIFQNHGIVIQHVVVE